MNLIICGRTQAARRLNSKSRRAALRAVVSIGSSRRERTNRHPPFGFQSFGGPRLRLEFDDIEQEVEYRSASGGWGGPVPAFFGPTEDHIRALLDFGKGLDLDAEGDLLIHCYVGISRSTAAAYIIHASQWGESRAREAAEYVYRCQARHQRYGFASPNTRMIEIASRLEGWDMLSPQDAVDDEWYLTDKWNHLKETHRLGCSKRGYPRVLSPRDEKKRNRKASLLRRGKGG